MSLLILCAAIIGIRVPAISYAIPAFRNVEDIIPDNVSLESNLQKSSTVN